MIPTIDNLSTNFLRYIDGVCPQDHPTAYQMHFNHVGKINLGYEIKVKNHCLLETIMDEMHINEYYSYQ